MRLLGHTKSIFCGNIILNNGDIIRNNGNIILFKGDIIQNNGDITLVDGDIILLFLEGQKLP